jgi:hypothetical protein
MTIESNPHCASFSKSSPGVCAVSEQFSGSWRVSTPVAQSGTAASSS